MSRHYTDRSSGPGMTLRALASGDQQQLAKHLGVSDAKELPSKLADPAFLRPIVTSLPPLSWLALDILIEASGVLTAPEWQRLLALSCTDVPSIAIHRAIKRISSTGLLIAQSGPREGWERLSLITECYDALSTLVAGVSLPSAEPPATALEAPSNRRRARDILALCTLITHRKLRRTQQGQPDRAALKRLVKGLGLELDAAEQMISEALLNRWLQGSDQFLPNVPALTRLDRSIVAGTACARYAAALRGNGWTSVAAVVRLTSGAHRSVGQVSIAQQQLSEHPYFQVVHHEGAAWVRKRAPEPARGDGHVTPSFEILLGPGASLETVGRVGLCCELQRIDHVLTLKLTPGSVAAARAAGLPADEIREALRAVGPHGLPDNVAVMLDDWIAGVRTVRVRTGRFIFAQDDDTTQRLEHELRGSIIDRPAPRVLEIAENLTDAALSSALARAHAIEARSALSEPDPEANVAPVVEAAKLEPDPELRALWMRARDSRDYGVSAQIVTASEIDSTTESLKRALRAQKAAKPACEILDVLAAWLKLEIEPLTHWASKQEAQNLERFDFAFTLNLVPWLVLDATERQRTLQAARDINALLEASQKRWTRKPPTLRQGAQQLLSKLDAPDVRKALVHVIGDNYEIYDEDIVDDDCEDFLELAESIEVIPDPTLERTPRSAATPGTPEPSIFRRARELRREVLARQPRSGALSVQGPSGVLALLTRAASSSSAVHVQLAAGRVLSVLVEGLAQRGHESVLHCVDLRAVESRAVKVADILGAQLDTESARPASP